MLTIFEVEDMQQQNLTGQGEYSKYLGLRKKGKNSVRCGRSDRTNFKLKIIQCL